MLFFFFIILILCFLQPLLCGKLFFSLILLRSSVAVPMPALVDYGGDDEYYPGGSFYSNPMDLDAFLPTSSHVDLYFCPSKRALICAPVVFGGGEFEQDCTPSIQALPDECLFEIFRHPHSARERSSCAGVSKRWLMLLSTIRKAEICKSRSTCISQMVECSNVEQQNTEFDEISVVNCDEDQEDESNGFLTRCLDGKKATDVRLAAIAVGTSGRGGLGNFQFEEVTLLVELPTLVFRPLPTVALLFGCFLCGMYLLEPNLQHRFKEMVDFLVEEWEEEGLYY
ncbi:EIN3-binding F-box protein 1-like isoform X2 [Cucumis melo]|uniref:EIN3-binding F-box protein 1-like isoform X2 n=1 Tax=Cucumis melo TaxID=3656 RepID=A0ABM3KSP1_CUCME|nr:EIN3-binding F-box protein 1-like isoform X2 [Cucumis melo]